MLVSPDDGAVFRDPVAILDPAHGGGRSNQLKINWRIVTIAEFQYPYYLHSYFRAPDCDQMVAFCDQNLSV